MPVHLQPALFPERVFAVVHPCRNRHGDYFRAECEPCLWISHPTPDYMASEHVAHAHNESHHAG